MPALLVATTVLLLLLERTLTMAPGDEYDGCNKPNYPLNTKVLLDSYRYQQLLPYHNGTVTSSTVWRSNDWYSSEGLCENSTVITYANTSDPTRRSLWTQYINKSVSAPDNYPVRVFVNLTLSTTIPPYYLYVRLELQIQHADRNESQTRDIQSTNPIQFHFDLAEGEDGFSLALRVPIFNGTVTTVSRILVYRHVCQPPISGCEALISVNDFSDREYDRSGIYLLDAMETQASRNVCFTSHHSANFSAQIVTRDGNAIGYFDYIPLNETVSFHGARVQCVNVQIVNDEFPEAEEIFYVDVLFGSTKLSSAQVRIRRDGQRSKVCNASISVASDVHNSSLQLVQMCSMGRISSRFAVCDDDWTQEDAYVVCRELGYDSLREMKTLRAPHDARTFFHFGNLNCRGDEQHLIECHSRWSRSLSICNDFLLVDCTNSTENEHIGNNTTLTIAPGDEYDGCRKPNYPLNTKVLLDSYRYQQLLPYRNGILFTIASPVWRSNGWYSSGGMCENSTVIVQSDVTDTRIEKWLWTQYINKSVPVADNYPVRIYVDVTLSTRPADNNFLELQIQHADRNESQLRYLYSYNPIQFHFDISEEEEGFSLGLKVPSLNGTTIISRILVYRHVCQPPISGCEALISVNSFFNDSYNHYRVYADGILESPWQPSKNICFTSHHSANFSAQIVTRDWTAIGNFDYVPVNETVLFRGSQVRCVEIQIVDDEFPENFLNEIFYVDVMFRNTKLSSVEFSIYDLQDRKPCTKDSVNLASDIHNSSLQLVQKCTYNKWQAVCDSDWTQEDANVVCRELGYTTLREMKTIKAPYDTYGEQPVCSGDEKTLSSCFSYTFSHICDNLLVECSQGYPNSTEYITRSTPTPVITASNTLVITASNTPVITASNTPVITVSNTPLPTESSTEDGGTPIAVVAGVIGAVVVTVIGLGLVIVLVVILIHKRKAKFSLLDEHNEEHEIIKYYLYNQINLPVS